MDIALNKMSWSEMMEMTLKKQSDMEKIQFLQISSRNTNQES